MTFTIRKLLPGDTNLFKQLALFFQVDDNVSEPIIPSDEYLENLLLNDKFHVVVAIKNGALAGGITAYELELYSRSINEMFLYEIAVVPKYRQRGIAKALIGFLKDICIERGIKEMYVGTSINNREAMQLYKSTGGEADDEIAWFVYQIKKKI
jgi:aminoglycoside 3-N-acetyltransferase I